MPTLKLETALVSTSHRYRLELSEQTTIRQLASYLSDHEAQVTTRTLEVAQPLQPDQLLRELDFRAGDRLIVLSQPPREAELPAPVRPGDSVLRFTSGDYEIRQHGKQGILIGRPDEARQTVPDVDLRYFVAPDALPYISRGCVWLSYDETQRVWFASRMGQTRIVINEYELTSERMALNPYQTMRFYRASDDPRNIYAQPIGELNLSIDVAQGGQSRGYFLAGSWCVTLCVGGERSRYFLNVSDQLPLGEIAQAVADYDRTTLMAGAQLYIARLLPPDTRLARLDLGEDALLYAAADMRFGRNFLRLVDVHQRERVYALTAGGADERRVGVRARKDVTDATLDVDLHDALIIHGHDPRTFQNIPRYLARIAYRPSENTWWIRAEERSRTPLHVNNARLSSATPIQLMSGDVITLGPSVTHYYARLEVEISTSIR